MKKILVLNLLLVFFVLVACTDNESDKITEAQNIKDKVESPKSSSSDFFNLSDEFIDSAIKSGINNSKSDMFKLEYSYFINVTNNNLGEFKKYPPYVYFRSPYYQIVKKAYDDSQKMITPTIEEMRGTIRANILDFYIEAFGNNLNMGENFHAILKQGNVEIQPVGGKVTISNSPERINLLSDSAPKYKRTMIASFMIDDRIDLSYSLSLVFIYSGKEDYAVYDFRAQQ